MFHSRRALRSSGLDDSASKRAEPVFVSDDTLTGNDDPQFSGGDVEEATPDPIPNSEVKLLGADGTAREAVWESRTSPGFSSDQA